MRIYICSENMLLVQVFGFHPSLHAPNCISSTMLPWGYYYATEEATLVAPVKPKHAKRSCGPLHFPIVFP